MSMSTPEEHDNGVEVIEIENHKPTKGVYLLPNLFTTAALFSGFYAVVAAMKGLFDLAAITIFIAMIADGLDGRIARLTNTESAFGAEYDSLSDMVAFGVAPALVLYQWSLQSLGKLGWLCAFVYVAAVAIRLARFNVQHGHQEKRFFIGLPCPSAAAILASLVWLGSDVHMNHLALPGALVALLTLAVAASMVSNIPYRSFKDFDIKNRVPFVTIPVIILVFVGVALKPDLMLFIVFGAFGLSGPVTWLTRRRRTADRRQMKDGVDPNQKVDN